MNVLILLPDFSQRSNLTYHLLITAPRTGGEIQYDFGDASLHPRFGPEHSRHIPTVRRT